ANPGSSVTNPGGDVGTGQLSFALDTTHNYGENAQGNWQLRITDRSGRGTGTLNGWKVDVYGSDLNETNPGLDTAGSTPLISATGNNQYFYTDEFGGAPGASRATLTDGNGGADILNATAVSSGSTINLNNGSASTIAGRSLTINGDVEHAFGGDGNDILTGNAQSNRLSGGRGNDTLNGGDQMDMLDGGQGNDTLTGGAGYDYFVIRKGANSVDTITDFSPGTVGEKILLVGFDNVTDYSQITVTQEGANTRLNLGDGQSVLLANIAPTGISEQNFGFFSDNQTLEKYANYMSNTSIYWGTSGVENGLLSNTLGDMRFFALGGDDVIGGRTANDLIDGGDGNDTIWGDYPGYTTTPGADWLEGGAGNDFLYGGAADDLLLGGSGNDNLQGEAGNDVLRGATGADVLSGGDGNDVLLGGAGDDFMDGGSGNDVLFMEGDWGTVNGTTYTYYGTRIGGAGADTFVVTANGGGNGSLVASGTSISAYNLIADFDPNQAGEVIDLTALKWVRGFGDLSIQNMTINGIAFARITATDGTNQLAINLRGVSGNALTAGHFKINPNPGLIIGTAYSDTLTGDAGGNTLDGGAGVDAMTGRTGDDTYIVDNVGDTAIELPDGGVDTIKSSVSYTLPANVENLVLTGTAAINGTGNDAANRLVGNAADNVLDGKGGVDALLGGAGDDTYVVDSQADTVVEYTSEGTDTVQSSVSYTLGNNIENLTLTGTDSINATGNDLVNTLTGNAGDNILDGAAGADTMAGGAGDDTYLVDNVGDVVAENAAEGIDTVYSTVDYALGADVENLVLATGAISGTGNALDNALTGNSAGNTLNSGAGNDMLDGGTGADTLLGGTGDDTYVVDNTSDVVTELAGEGSDTVVASVSFDLSTRPDVENVVLTGTANLNATGNAANNRLVGNAGANALSGGAGDDALDGGAGADTLIGGMGNDIYVVDNVGDVVTENTGEGTDTVVSSISYMLGANLENLTLVGSGAINGTGNGLDNTLTGNWNANVLDGGVGNDTLDGGGGADTLIGGAGDDTYKFSVGGGADTIVDSGGTDQLVFGAGILATGVTASRTGSQVTLAVSATDSISFDETVPGQYAVETVSFSGGTVWLASDIRQLVNSAPTGSLDISGTATQGQTLTAINTLADADGLGAIGYQWQTSIDGIAWNTIAGATASSLTLSEAQVGKQVRVSASYTDGHGTVENMASAATAAVANVNDAPTGAVTLSGTATQSQTLTATSTLADIDGLGVIGYQWQSSTDAGVTWAAISGATASTFTLTEAQVGKQVRVNATYTDGHGTAESMASSPSSAVTGYQAGTSGNDSLVGTAYSDTLLGLAGNDTLDGGAGVDTLVGGLGDDTYTVDNTGDVVTENSGEGIDTVYSSANYFQLAANIENLTLIRNGTRQSGLGNALDNILIGTAGDESLNGAGGADTMIGGLGGDTYYVDNVGDVIVEYAGEGKDNVYSYVTYSLGDNLEWLYLSGTASINGTGNALDNLLEGNTGNNTLDGGAGNDQLRGGGGNDTYMLTRGSGADVANDSYGYSSGYGKYRRWIVADGGADTLSLGAGINMTDLELERSGLDLVVGLRSGGIAGIAGQLADRMTLQSWTNTYNKIETIQFADGSQYQMTNWLIGTAAGDTLTASTSGTHLFGGSGNDVLNGGTGSDWLDGGVGADTLIGGAGDDTYLLGRGSGGDILTENDSTAGNVDTISVRTGVDADQLWFRHVDGNLEVSVVGTLDSMTIQNWYSGSAYHVEQFQTADGKLLLDTQVENLVQAMAAFAPPASGQTTLPPTYQSALAPVLAANWH
ncbi:MAG: calcium-binding protein, partial [Sulfuritalea sp.]|nr:calcium-binding protein [Sulfuritalea sp.]